MTLNNRSNICAEVTDQTPAQDKKMTDAFLKVFSINFCIEMSAWASDDSILFAEGYCIMSPRVHSHYLQWIESLPPLMKELL
jgi:hypothetical protein